MDTYLEPIDGADPMGQQSTNAGVEDLSVTEIISGGTLSEGELSLTFLILLKKSYLKACIFIISHDEEKIYDS